MRDPRLEEAVRAAGGVTELARQIEISQPSVSNWSRVPAECVLIVEAATGVNCKVLRPDLYGETVQDQPAPDDVTAARAQEYALLATLLGRAPDAKLLKNLGGLRGDATPLGVAHAALAQAASETTVERVEREFFNLFIGLGRGELLPYASYYLTGFLHERPLARVREDLDRLGIERAGTSREPEDHIAILLEVMAGLARNDFEAGFDEQKQFFERHLKPWAARMFADLEMSQAASFYRAVGRVGRVFMELESEAFTLSE
jgi:TorA maturation chaperone TorD